MSLWDESDCELTSKPTPDETFTCEDERRWLRVKSHCGEYAIEVEHEVTHTETETADAPKEKKVRQRDWDLEFKLLERVEPKHAEEIDAKAEAKGQKAKDATCDLLDAFESRVAQPVRSALPNSRNCAQRPSPQVLRSWPPCGGMGFAVFLPR